MGRTRKSTRRGPRTLSRGVLEVAPDGFGFVQTAEGEFFVPASKMAGAFDGDVVEVAVAGKAAGKGKRAPDAESQAQRGRRPTARVVRVVTRAHETIVGRYEVADPFGVVVPTDVRIPYDIFTLRADNPGIPHGALVRVRMVEYPSRASAATGVVEEVLGMDGAPGMDIEALIARHRLETRFSDAARAQVADAAVDVEDALAAGYADERDRFVFTIDPVDARDFDDAISLVALDPHGGAGVPGADAAPSPGSPSAAKRLWRLGVHIADVSHYVQWGSAVDVDARKRATSVYLVDRVVPMLPEALSNDVCSLAPGVPRRVVTVDVVLDDQAHVYGVDCHRGIIESKARLSYEQAQCYLDAARRGASCADAALDAAAQPMPAHALPLDEAATQALFEALPVLHKLALARTKAREAVGGLDFETTEAKVQLDEEGEPTGVAVRARTDATSCIEEAMILANECVARRLADAGAPGLFRVHGAPGADALAALVPVLQEFGYDKAIDMADLLAGQSAAIQAVLKRAHGRTEAELVSQLLLQAQQRAVYKPTCDGHFGLALTHYCHFTSPIRRYPDLVVHRMLGTLMVGKGETYQAQVDSLPWLAEHASNMERVAEAAARESQEIKLVAYMERFVGQDFAGIVSGVTTAGLFVRLENTAEGVVPLRALGNEYFSLDPVLHRLSGQDSGTTYRLGQRVRVRIQPADPHARKLNLRLVSR